MCHAHEPQSDPYSAKMRTAILRTSRAIYNEAFPIMVSSCHFQLRMLSSPDPPRGNLVGSETCISYFSCARTYTVNNRILDWQCWDGLPYVRNLQISYESHTAHPWNDFDKVEESLQIFEKLKSLKLYFTTYQSCHGPRADELAKCIIKQFTYLTNLNFKKFTLDIRVAILDGTWKVRPEYIGRMREILASVEGSKVSSIEGVQIMEFHKNPRFGNRNRSTRIPLLPGTPSLVF